MPEFFLELFSEEIPARMQARAADDLARVVGEMLKPLSPADIRTFSGPRRIALAADVRAEISAQRSTERGPRKTAPEQALAGFLRKHNATREQLREEGDFLVLERVQSGVAASELIAREMPGVLRRFPWPKSMRWGGTSQFTWVRPLRRIVCLLDGVVVAFALRHGDDDGHGLHSGDLTEGHRFMAPGAFAVSSCAQWQRELRARRVIVDAVERRTVIAAQVTACAEAARLHVVDDPGLLDEVAGLVEWPTALVGTIDPAFMDLPAEVMQVSMRVNQRYFALRHADGTAAPRFVFVSNIEARDGGATSIAGNERVLRARFSDARHFWDLDRKRTLASRVAALDGVTFHAKLGSQGDRVRRLVKLAGVIAPLVGADAGLAERAAILAKADLTTGMVGEFPELQGVMGRYYALHDGEQSAAADAVRDHYAPKGASDSVPTAPVSVAVALADKVDQLVGFFAAGEKPSGSGDPYALRRAALGVIRILLDNRIRLRVTDIINAAKVNFDDPDGHLDTEVYNFLIERLRAQMRGEGKRHDIFAAVFSRFPDANFVRAVERFDGLTAGLTSDIGRDLMAAYRRAANILRAEDKKDGPHDGTPDPTLFTLAEERDVAARIEVVAKDVSAAILAADYDGAMASLASLRAPVDAFFDRVTVNDPRPELRRNRLALLFQIRSIMSFVADFSKIEGT